MKKRIYLKEISIVIPFFNEKERVEKSINILSNYLAKNKIKIEIIFVNDGSKDLSNNLILKKLKKFKIRKNIKIKMINYLNNKGKGYAIIQGMKKARYKWILTCDFDMSVKPDTVNKWFKKKYITNKNFAYFASRNNTSSKVETFFLRKLYGFFFRTMVKILFGINLKDTQCGFKLYYVTYLKKIINKLTSYGFVQDIEIVNELMKRKIKIIELPVYWRHMPNSKLSLLADPLKMIIDLIKIKFK